MSVTTRGAVYGLAAGAIWGAMYIISDVVLKTIPPFTLLTIRLLLGAGVLAFISWRSPNLRRPTRREILQLLGVGIVGFGISVGSQFVGTDKSTGVNGALVTSASPAFILVFAALILREKLTLQRLAAVILATIGVMVIVDLSKADFSSATFWGDMALALAAVMWGLYSVLVRVVSARLDTLTVSLYAFMGGLIITVPAAALELQDRSIGTIDGGTILGILYLGIVSTAVAMWLWNRAFALVDASVASLFFFAQPLVGAVLGVLLGQPFTPNLWIGGLLIAFGVLLSMVSVEWLNRRASKTPVQSAET
ncbi:MAG TPA: DMT family transporter [Phototrophicaceae bacterium]|nr:DMT family transporter [Phototrophicaceae bacterium]